MKQGKLYLIPITLGDSAPLEVLPISNKRAIEQIDHYIAENEKTARAFIKRLSSGKSQSDLHFEQLNKFTEPSIIPEFLNPCLEGNDIGLMSEAGCPGVADPGADIVKIAHEKGIQVVPLVGPSSILLALMASGLNGQRFAFNGYLPIESADRKKAIKQLEKKSRDEDQAQIFMETPYRNDKMVADLIKYLHPDTRLCIATDITLESEQIKTLPIGEWEGHLWDLNKRPTIYVMQA